MSQELIKAVQVKLEEATERLFVPPWPSAAVKVSPTAVTFQQRRFGRAARLLRSIAAFEGAVPTGTLRRIALTSVIQRQACLTWLQRATAVVILLMCRSSFFCKT